MGPALVEDGIDHLERHDPGQLAQMPRREHPEAAPTTPGVRESADKGLLGFELVAAQLFYQAAPSFDSTGLDQA
ncbi:hypothetical protein GCM10029992_66020 [Glycomyces albus]